MELGKLNQDFSEIVKKGGIALAIRIMGFLAGYLFIYLIVHFFGAETQGRLSLSFSIMIIGSLFCRLGVDVNFVKVFAIKNNLENARGIYHKIIPLLLIVSSVVSIIIFVFSRLISEKIFEDSGLTPYLLWTAPCILFFTMVLVNAGVLRGLRKNTIYAFLFNGGRFLFSLVFLGLLLWLYGENSIVPIIAHSTAIFMLLVISFLQARKYIFPRIKKSSYQIKGFLKESFPMLLSASLIVFLGWTDTIVLGIYKDSSTVGIYSVIIKIAAVISFSLQALDSILAPKLSHSYHNNDLILFKKLVWFTTKLNTIIAISAVVFILVFNDFILGIFGPEFKGAFMALVILCVGQLFNSIFGPVGSIFQMTGRQTVFQNILIVSFLINLTLNIILVKNFGINGVAFATAVSLIISKILSAYYIKKLIWTG